ncbi:TetR/AcrR family transcriptional regulator [Pantoea dispersa]|uniref:TetR/AcrR family transcriptional regulator n=1 Tax=Pantoea dispersa TaxID=59814 RepID=UPI0021F702DC|nr:TetR/AcrR family transcriptional regulator [Pantoea dispersa]UYP72458.1 TetR/AcrR family transcriptional regulator [Pantoea dispersa]
MRRDAVVRREKILDAAEIEFSLRGISTPLESVAERAGVGPGTFYRNFPDRQALLDALLDRSLTRMESRENGTDSIYSTCELLEHIAQNLVTSPVLSEYWRSTGRDSKAANLARERFVSTAERCLAKGLKKENLRHDLVAEDFPLISSMLGAILCGRDLKEREKIKERVLSLLYNGLLSRD